MPKYFNNENLTRECFERYCELRGLLASYEPKDILVTHYIDGRDVQPIFLAMNNGNPIGNNEDIGKKYQEFCASFNNNPKVALDGLFDYLERFEFKEFNSKEDILNAMTYLGVNQAFCTALQKNPEYRDVRFGKDLDMIRRFDALMKKSAVINKLLDDELQRDYKLNISALGESNNEPMPYDSDEEREWEENLLREEASIVQSYANALSNEKGSIELTVTKNWAIASSNDPNKYENASNRQLLSQLFRASSNPDSYSMLSIKALGEDANFNRIYVQGKPLSKCVEDFENKSREEKMDLAANIVANAVKTGKAIDLVDYHVDNGKAFAKIIPIKFNYTQEVKKAFDKEHKMTYPWWRRKLFNWGPFKIKNPIDYNKVNKANEKEASKRNDETLKNFKAYIKNKIEDNYPSVINKERSVADNSNPTRNTYLKIPKILTKEDIMERRQIEIKEELNSSFECNEEEAKDLLNEINNTVSSEKEKGL